MDPATFYVLGSFLLYAVLHLNYVKWGLGLGLGLGLSLSRLAPETS